MLISIYTIHMGYCCLWFPMVSRSEIFHVDTGRCGSQTAPSRRHLGEQRDRSQKAKKAIMALGFLDIFGRFGDKIGLCMSLESEFSCGCLRFTIFRQTLDLRWTAAFANQQGKQKNKPGASTERLQPWRELASHDLCQLAWIFRRHSWYVQRDLEVWSHDRGCVGGVQASHLYLHPQARWVAWWCLGGHWSGHQPWEDGDWAAPIVTSMSVPSIWPKRLFYKSWSWFFSPQKWWKWCRIQLMFPLKRSFWTNPVASSSYIFVWLVIDLIKYPRYITVKYPIF